MSLNDRDPNTDIFEAVLGLQSKRILLTTATSALICGLQLGLTRHKSELGQGNCTVKAGRSQTKNQGHFQRSKSFQLPITLIWAFVSMKIDSAFCYRYKISNQYWISIVALTSSKGFTMPWTWGLSLCSALTKPTDFVELRYWHSIYDELLDPSFEEGWCCCFVYLVSWKERSTAFWREKARTHCEERATANDIKWSLFSKRTSSINGIIIGYRWLSQWYQFN